METQTYDYKKIGYPPGGILIWMIILVEILTFSIAIFVFLIQRGNALEVFNESQVFLNKTLGTFNTAILVTSGFFMANALHKLKEGDNKKSSLWVVATIIMGIGFLVLKGIEYSQKIEHGLFMDYSQFYTYYWLLTGFHFIHVLVGVLILTYLLFKIKSGHYNKNNFFDVETGGAFWHMCDLIWLFLFPVLYLLH